MMREGERRKGAEETDKKEEYEGQKERARKKKALTQES